MCLNPDNDKACAMFLRPSQCSTRRAFSLLELVCAIGFFALISAALTGLWGTLLTRADDIRTRREALHIAELFEVYATSQADDYSWASSVQQIWVYDPIRNPVELFLGPSADITGAQWQVKLMPIAMNELGTMPLYELQVFKDRKCSFYTLYEPSALPSSF
ncbi:MAG TPA: type II secretion system protein [Opitutales bacterium]|nr:type II secretion system protein [Opitutales bacterium]